MGSLRTDVQPEKEEEGVVPAWCVRGEPEGCGAGCTGEGGVEG